MNPYRLLRYLSIDRHVFGSLERYEKSVAGNGGHNEEVSYPWLSGHYQGMLDDLIKIIGHSELIAFLDAKQKLLEKINVK